MKSFPPARSARLGKLGCLVLLVAASACTKKPSGPSEPAAAPTAGAPDSTVAPAVTSAADPAPDLASRGRAVYLANCTACHNSDPHRAGALGPEIAGSSLALVEARVLRAEYPPGYEPKRKSKAMVALPQLQAEIPAIVAFLNAP